MRGLAAAAAALLVAQPGAAQGVVHPPAAPAAAAPHQRVLPLQGGHNFRDLGGYRTMDGRMVRWGLLYRSGQMHDLTLADYAYLQRLGIRTVCDLRDRRERAAQPTRWPAGHAPRILSDDYDLDMRGMMLPGDPGSWTREQVVERMAATYPQLLEQFRDQYRRMFAQLLAGQAPLAFHCTAGKDRTGVGAALLLSALGVPRATVIDDYLLSNRYTTMPTGTPTGFWAKLSPAAAGAFAGVDRRYIDAVFADIDRRPGGMARYLKEAMGLDRAAIARLRHLYLTRG